MHFSVKIKMLAALLCLLLLCTSVSYASPSLGNLNKIISSYNKYPQSSTFQTSQTNGHNKFNLDRQRKYHAEADLMRAVDEAIATEGAQAVIDWARSRLYSNDTNEEGHKLLLKIIDRAMSFQKQQTQPLQPTAKNSKAQIEWDAQQRIEAFCQKGGDAQELLKAATAERNKAASPKAKHFWDLVIKETRSYL
ncbi:hypothetical protein IJT17_08875 [bacterium]|nr:hypothetical protein [bacterium]